MKPRISLLAKPSDIGQNRQVIGEFRLSEIAAPRNNR
jgi:hypothetical protein